MPSHAINPEQLAQAGLEIQGDLPLSAFTFDHAFESGAIIHYTLKGGFDEHQNVLFLCGTIRANLQGPCQRCMKSCDVKVDNTFLLGIVHDEVSMKQLPSEYEPLLIKNKEVELASIIGEELILCTPIVMTHALNECSVQQEAWQYGDTSTKGALADREHPFAKLAGLKQKKTGAN